MPEDVPPRPPFEDDGPSPGGVAANLRDALIRERLRDTAKQRSHTRSMIAAGRPIDAEQDPDRRKRFLDRRRRRMAPGGAEAWHGNVMEALGSAFLAEGATIRRAVAFLEVNGPTSSELGTGFLVSPDLLITNCHVIADANAALGAQAYFDREADEAGRPRAPTTFRLDPERFLLTSPESELDYALVALGEKLSGPAEANELGFCRLSDAPDRHVLGMNVNIIQHPRGLAKMAAIRKNLLLARTDRTLHYQTDTDEGSSGAPVFNDDWDVVALHHWGGPFLEQRDDTGARLPLTLNEGVRISAIVHDLKQRLPGLPAGWQALLAAVLSPPAPLPAGNRRLGAPRRAAEAAPVLAPPASSPRSPPLPPPPIGTGEIAAMSDDGQTTTVTIPLTITVSVQLGQAGAAAAVPAAPRPLSPPRSLTRAAEALRRDRDYANREGYDPDFIPGVTLPLPGLSPALAAQLAPLRAGEAAAEEGVLRYVHFSIMMNKVRRIAIVAATNIEGESYLAVDRDTGRVTAEGDSWFHDPRISASFVLDQRFYSEWSHLFDRGHLVRRSDPTWGSKVDAERANADSFHFTNCSPQHFRFNQSAAYWQGLERYVLENGVLAEGTGKRLTVFQGPIFEDAIDLWADDVQIPSSFFKIVAWQGRDRLRAVGLVADQKDLLAEERRFLGTPRDLPLVDVRQWRVAIEVIERRTGLDFGGALREADTIRQRGQPAVGAEAARLVRRLEDIDLG